MPTCVPIKAMKDTTRFVEVVNGAKEPVTVTRNGYDALVVMTPEMYDGMRLDAARHRLYERLATAEAQRGAGDYVDGEAFLEGLLDHAR